MKKKTVESFDGVDIHIERYRQSLETNPIYARARMDADGNAFLSDCTFAPHPHLEIVGNGTLQFPLMVKVQDPVGFAMQLLKENNILGFDLGGNVFQEVNEEDSFDTPLDTDDENIQLHEGGGNRIGDPAWRIVLYKDGSGFFEHIIKEDGIPTHYKGDIWHKDHVILDTDGCLIQDEIDALKFHGYTFA